MKQNDLGYQCDHDDQKYKGCQMISYTGYQNDLYDCVDQMYKV